MAPVARPKNEDTLHFAKCLENYQRYVAYTTLLHTSRLVYTEYNLFTPGLVTLFHTVAPSGESSPLASAGVLLLLLFLLNRT